MPGRCRFHAEEGRFIGDFEEGDKLFAVHTRTDSPACTTSRTRSLVGPGHSLPRQRYDPEQVFSILYFEGGNFNYMVKRFTLEGCPMTTEFQLLSEHPDTRMVEFFATEDARVLMEYQMGREVKKEELDLTEVADVKTYKALGSKFTAKKVKRVTRIEEPAPAKNPKASPKAKDPRKPDLFD